MSESALPESNRRGFFQAGALMAGASFGLAMLRNAQASPCPEALSHEFVRLTDFKDPPDGDDGVLFDRAMNYLGANGGTIFIPKGEYRVYTQVDLRNNIRLLGEGKASKIILSQEGRFRCAFYDVPGNPIHANICLENFLIESALLCPGPTDHGGRTAIFSSAPLKGSSGITIRRMHLNNCGIDLNATPEKVLIVDNTLEGLKSGIKVDGNAKQVVIARNRVHNFGNFFTEGMDEGAGMSYDGIACMTVSEHITISDNIVRECQGNGIWALSARHTAIQGNICLGNGYSGIGLNNSSGNKPWDITVTHNVCEANVWDGIDINFGNVTPRYPAMFALTGNLCRRNLRSGIYLHHGQSMAVSANVCERNGFHGIKANHCTLVNIHSNIVLSNNTRGLAPENTNDAGIELFQSPQCTVYGNVTAVDGVYQTQTYGIALKGLQGSTDNALLGNIGTGSPGRPVYFKPENVAAAGAPEIWEKPRRNIALANQPNSDYDAANRGIHGGRRMQGFGSPENQVSGKAGDLYFQVDPSSTNPKVVWVKKYDSNTPNGPETTGWYSI